MPTLEIIAEAAPGGDVLAQYGFLGILFASAMVLLRGIWTGGRWLGNRLFGTEGIVTRFLEKQAQAIEEVSESVTGMSMAITHSVEILQETRGLVGDLKGLTQHLDAGITTTGTSISTTHRALWAMADAILSSTPEDRRQEVKPHIEEIKRILDARP